MPEPRYITIVDDHTLFRKGLAALINLFDDYQVLSEASHGKHFIAQLNPKQLPDIVLLDINMPEMDGYATAEWIRMNHPEINVLALSTMDAETAIIKIIKHGAKGYVLKDAEPSELKRAFDEVISKGYFYNDIVTRKVMKSINELVQDASGMQTFVKLTDREIEFMKHVCTEKTYFEISKDMFLSERTIDGYRESLFKKLSVNTRVGLAMYAIKHGIVRL